MTTTILPPAEHICWTTSTLFQSAVKGAKHKLPFILLILVINFLLESKVGGGGQELCFLFAAEHSLKRCLYCIVNYIGVSLTANPAKFLGIVAAPALTYPTVSGSNPFSSQSAPK